MATTGQMDLQLETDREDLSDLVSALDTSRSSSSPEAYDEFLHHTLRLSVDSGSVPRTLYLLEVENASAEHLRHNTVAANPSVNLLETVTRFGYDPDAPGARDTPERGYRLIDYPSVLQNDAVVRWLVDQRGVSLDHGQHEYEILPQPPPLLQSAGQYCSRATFGFLRENGAKLGRRTLHATVLFAAAIKADPAVPPSSEFLGFDASKKWGPERKRMSEMLPYLVDELRLDVNALDIEREEPILTGHYGTPLCYAVYHNGAAVVRWLLSKGADPRFGDADQRADAVRLANALGAERCLDVFKEWTKARAND